MPASDQRAQYQQWVSDHHAELFRFAYRLLGHRDQAEELTQETFFHAWRSIESLKEPERARAWLFQIMRHRFSHTLRTRSRRPQTTGAVALDERLGQATPEPLERMAKQEAVQKALDALDDSFRVPFLMVFGQGLTCREAAEELDIPLGTVLSRIHRARQTMKGVLTAIGYGPDDDAMDKDNDTPRFRLGGTA